MYLKITIVVQKSKEVNKVKKIQISDAEFCVMKALWKNEPCTSSEIVDEVSKKQNWNDKTIRTLISRLVSKGAAKAEKNCSKAFVYSSVISEKDYMNVENKNFLNKLYGGSVKLMLASFVENNNLSKEEIENLKEILEGK